MLKITNDGLTRSRTGIAVPMWQQWASKGPLEEVWLCPNFLNKTTHLLAPPVTAKRTCNYVECGCQLPTQIHISALYRWQ